MQVIVPRADLTLAADEVVHVLYSYDDAATNMTTMKPEWTIMSVNPVTSVVLDKTGMQKLLAPEWRNNSRNQIVSFEASLRVNAVFPDYSQRNANNEMNGYITTYGANSAAWPSGQQARKAEMDRCWAYINAVRQTANAMVNAALPADPTSDSNWPTRVPPYVPAP